MIIFKDDQFREAQAWIVRSQELEAYHVNAHSQLHAELRDRTEQMNQLWVGYQRQVSVDALSDFSLSAPSFITPYFCGFPSQDPRK